MGGGVAGWGLRGGWVGWLGCGGNGWVGGQSLGGMGCAFCSSPTGLPPHEGTAGSGQELSQPTLLEPSTALRGGRSHCFILDTRKPVVREREEPPAPTQPETAHSGPLGPQPTRSTTWQWCGHSSQEGGCRSVWKPRVSSRKADSCAPMAPGRGFFLFLPGVAPRDRAPSFPAPVGCVTR